jgi:RNA polymerase sigma-70 factor (ECF subfamily)
MGFFREVELGASFAPSAALREYFGFVPAVFRCQGLLPRLIEAEAGLAASIVFQDRALSRKRKERLLLILSAAIRSAYCSTTHYQMLCLLGEPEERIDQLLSDYRQTNLPAADMALSQFALKLSTNGHSISREDFTELDTHGWTCEIVLEAILSTAWARFMSCLSTGLGAIPDFEPVPIPAVLPFVPQSPRTDPAAEGEGPHLQAPEFPPEQFAPSQLFREHFGLIPNVFRAQTLRPDLIEAEAEAIRLVLLPNDHLTRLQKEQILLVVSASNRNTYFVALQSKVLGTLGILPADADKIAVEHHQASLAEADTLLLDFVLKLAAEPSAFGAHELAPLRSHGFTDEQILEAVVMTSFTEFLNTLQLGLGARPDFVPLRVFSSATSKVANLLAAEARPTEGSVASDPDIEAVARVQGGDVDAFEDLINRHSRRIYRTLVGILGNPEEARDAMQDTFLKAFQHLGSFQGRSKFSTWLVSIASNTGLQLLRDRKGVQSLDDDAFETDEGVRPRQIRAWIDDPEQLCSKAEMRALVEDHVTKLPAKYRVVVVLRDIEQLSIEESAAALGLGIPALKSRHLRGRLMLREALTAQFAARAQGGTA